MEEGAKHSTQGENKRETEATRRNKRKGSATDKNRNQ